MSATETRQRREQLTVVRNFLEWHRAIHGGGATVAEHAALLKEGRPKPTLDEALAALAYVEKEGK